MTRATEPGAPVGAAEIAKQLLDNPRAVRYAVIAFDVARLIDDVDSGLDTAVVRIQRVEPLTGSAMDQARELLDEAVHARLGEGQLDFNEGDAG